MLRRIFTMLLAFSMPFMTQGLSAASDISDAEALPISKNYKGNNYQSCTGCKGCGPSPLHNLSDLAQTLQQIVRGQILAAPDISFAIVSQIFSNPASVELVTQAVLANGVGGISQYAYIYNDGQTDQIPPGGNVHFQENGIITPGIVHTPFINPIPGSDSIVVLFAGVYKIDFFTYEIRDVTPSGSVFSLCVNGAVIPGATFKSAIFTPNPGQVIVSLSAGDTITLKNESAFTVQLGGAPGVVNSFISILQLN